MVGLSATVVFAAPAPPVVSGPTAIQFSYHPSGFRSTLTWAPVPEAVEYRVYDADTLYFVGTVTAPTAAIYGMQGVLYHHYVVAVDASGNASAPSNIIDIMTTAPVPPAAPASFDALPMSVFGLQTSSQPSTEVPVKIPYNPLEVTGDPAGLRMLHYTGSSWTDITTSVDTVAHYVYGLTNSFSVFAVMEPNNTPAASTITPTSGPGGSITPATAQVVAYGSDSDTFTVIPQSGYHIADVFVDGVSVGAISSHTFRNVTSDHTISASFAADPITLATTTTLVGPLVVRPWRAFRLSGLVSPSAAGQTVTIVESRLFRGSWIAMGSVDVPVISGLYVCTVTPMQRGTWRFVATYAGHVDGITTYLPSSSAMRTVTVR